MRFLIRTFSLLREAKLEVVTNKVLKYPLNNLADPEAGVVNTRR